MTQPLLTIAIPTYNRAEYLDINLNQLFNNLKQLINPYEIEIIVSNNASTDSTSEIVEKYLEKGMPIKYLINNENIGADGNFFNCYNLAKGKYLWLFGDDDFLRNDSLIKLLEILRANDFSLLYINHSCERIPSIELNCIKTIEFNNLKHFLEKVGWLPFISAVIVNKEIILDSEINHLIFKGTNLLQVSFYLESYLKNDRCVFIENDLIFNLPFNSTSYQLFKTFCEDYNRILKFYIKRGLDKEVKHFINNKNILTDFQVLKSPRFNEYHDSLSFYFYIFKNLSIYRNFWKHLFPKIFLKSIYFYKMKIVLKKIIKKK